MEELGDTVEQVENESNMADAGGGAGGWERGLSKSAIGWRESVGSISDYPVSVQRPRICRRRACGVMSCQLPQGED